MYQKPKTAKRLFFDVIPKNVDDYLAHLASFEGQEPAKRLENPVWHIHNGQPPREQAHLTFSLLLNLVAVTGGDSKDVLWGFISRYAPDANPENDKLLDRLVGYAIAYDKDFVAPHRRYRAASEEEKAQLGDLLARLDALPDDTPGEDIQNEVYAVGKAADYENLRDWFKALYEILLGQEQGPRLGSFFALYGLENAKALLKKAIAGEELRAG